MFVIVYVLFLPFAFSEIELGQRFALRKEALHECESGVLIARAKEITCYLGTEEKKLEGNNVYYPS